jgi:riboflavin-specific deaminase-like protein
MMLHRSAKIRPVSLPGVEAIWSLLLRLAERARNAVSNDGTGFLFHGSQWTEVSQDAATLWFNSAAPRGYESALRLEREATDLLDLFTPLCVGARAERLVVGHIGQSLDGRIATPTGASQFITGNEDLTHTHRLRAMCDAVVVGGRTVFLDDPKLTTRRVRGLHATRVVLDPSRKLADKFTLFSDPTSRTLIVADEKLVRSGDKLGQAEVVGATMNGSSFCLDSLLHALRVRGLRRIFVEGGGVTVSRFLEQGAFDRLHVTTAPMILGSGASSIALPPIDKLSEALRFSAKPFVLGRDVLFDCDLRSRPND